MLQALKDKLIIALGTAGYIIYYLVFGFLSVLPFIMIDVPWYVLLILIAAYLIVPSLIPILPVQLGIWIWGLVCAINGPQNFLAILYYIVFVIQYVIPILIAIISALFDR